MEKCFDQQEKNYVRTYNKIRKIETGQGDDYTTSGLLDYVYFKDCYKMIAIYISKNKH